MSHVSVYGARTKTDSTQTRRAHQHRPLARLVCVGWQVLRRHPTLDRDALAAPRVGAARRAAPRRHGAARLAFSRSSSSSRMRSASLESRSSSAIACSAAAVAAASFFRLSAASCLASRL